jgi:hypothetical protein
VNKKRSKLLRLVLSAKIQSEYGGFEDKTPYYKFIVLIKGSKCSA